MPSIVTLLPQPQETALNFIGGSVSNNPSAGTIDITTALGIPAIRSRAKISTNQSIANSANQVLIFDTIVYDANSIYSTVSGSFTIPAGQGGVWQAWGEVGFAGHADNNNRGLAVTVNGDLTNANAVTLIPANGSYSGSIFLTISDVLILNVGDFVQFTAFQSSGGALNAIAGFGGLIKLL